MKYIKINLFLLLAFMLGACETNGGSSAWSPDKETIDPVNSILQFSDVPVPTGFKLDSKASFSYQKDQKRFGKLLYSGKMDANELETFMIDQLEFQQWKLESKTLRAGTNALFFSKGSEELQIYISGSGWGMTLEIILG